MKASLIDPEERHRTKDRDRMSPLQSTPGGIMLDQKIRSGSPRLHPFFETGPAAVPATAGSLEWGGSRTSPSRASTDLAVNAPWNSGRRYSSADLVLRGVKARAGFDGAAREQQEAGQANEGKGNNNQRRQSQTRPALLVSTVPKSPIPLSSNSVIAQASGENDSGCTDEASMSVSPRTAPIIVSSNCSPTDCAASSASSVASHCPSDDASSTLSDETADTEATSPGRSPDGDETPIARAPADLEKTFKRASRREPPRGRRRTRASTGPLPEALGRYGTPEMPRGTAKFPHIPATAGLTPRVPGYQGHFVKHLPRAEKLPMSGYELLASTISSCPPSSSTTTAAPAATTPSRLGAFVGSQRLASRRSSVASFVTTSASSVRSGSEEVETAGLPGGGDASSLKPIYRRFEALNHRMLLHLQDELSELEEQLHRLDTTDTQTRRLPSRILPASRRAEHLAGGELQSQKADVLGKIGSKLGQYSKCCRRPSLLVKLRYKLSRRAGLTFMNNVQTTSSHPLRPPVTSQRRRHQTSTSTAATSPPTSLSPRSKRAS